MARTVNIEAHRRRSTTFLDTAQRLIEEKGYEQMTIQDVLSELGTSKGSLYHYFDSKEALLEGILDRAIEGYCKPLARCVGDEHLDPVEKLQELFNEMLRDTNGHGRLVVGLAGVLENDENALVRQRMERKADARIGPLIKAIVADGVRCKVFTTSYPDTVGDVVLSLLRGLDQRISALFHAAVDDIDQWLETIAVFTNSIERVLGLRPGSLIVLETDQLKRWFSIASQGYGRQRKVVSEGEEQWETTFA